MATAKEKSPEAENGNNSLANLLSGLHTASDNVNSPHANGIDFSSVNTKVICCKYLYWNNIGLLTILYCLIITLMQDALVKPTESQFDLLVKKIQYLIEMGNGETILEVGAGEGN